MLNKDLRKTNTVLRLRKMILKARNYVMSLIHSFQSAMKMAQRNRLKISGLEMMIIKKQLICLAWVKAGS